jgi:hypothetical protein
LLGMQIMNSSCYEGLEQLVIPPFLTVA